MRMRIRESLWPWIRDEKNSRVRNVHPGRGQKGIGSRIRIRNTVWNFKAQFAGNGKKFKKTDFTTKCLRITFCTFIPVNPYQFLKKHHNRWTLWHSAYLLGVRRVADWMPLPDTLVYGGRKPGQRTAWVHFHFLMINVPFNLIFNKRAKCSRSVTFCYGSVRIRTTDLRIRIPLFSSMTFKIPTKNNFFSKFSCLTPKLFKVHLHPSSKIKSRKEVTKEWKSRSSYYFCLTIEGYGSGFIPTTYGSGRPN